MPKPAAQFAKHLAKVQSAPAIDLSSVTASVETPKDAKKAVKDLTATQKRLEKILAIIAAAIAAANEIAGIVNEAKTT